MIESGLELLTEVTKFSSKGVEVEEVGAMWKALRGSIHW